MRDWALHEVNVPVGRVMQEREAELVFLAVDKPVSKEPVEVGVVARVKREVTFLRVVGDSCHDLTGFGQRDLQGGRNPSRPGGVVGVGFVNRGFPQCR